MTVPGVGGRPLKFETPEELQRQVDDYFITAEEKGEHFSVLGMALHLNTTRETLADYEKKDGYSDIIKMAKARVAHAYEQHALNTKNPAGAIFLLKANFKYSDRLEIEHSGAVNIHFDKDDKKVM